MRVLRIGHTCLSIAMNDASADEAEAYDDVSDHLAGDPRTESCGCAQIAQSIRAATEIIYERVLF